MAVASSKAAHVVVVHARQIVVDQRIDVDRLDRAADAERAFTIDREQSRRSNGEERSQPLAAADRRVAHRLIERLAAIACRWKQPGEEIIDFGRDLGGFRVELLPLAMALQSIAFLVKLDRLVERRLALLERADDLLEPRKRGLEAQLADVGLSGGHGRLLTPDGS
jgi:hypothetical protein